MRSFTSWLAIAALALGCVSAARGDPAPAASANKSDAVQWDPTIRHGVLPNGLRYAVMHNATPAGGVSIRLGLHVGSVDEGPDELGAAHFLEHMAFGGSHAQLQADVEKTFSDAGVAFGRDRNAETGPSDTTYKIDLPHADAAALDLGFRWLRQVADGVHLTDADVDRERSVIQAEREQRLSNISLAGDRILAFQTPGTRLAAAPLIGTQGSIAGLTAAHLQAFYNRWYHPQNAAVVVIGDESVDALEARVKSAFGTWQAQGVTPRQPDFPLDPRRGLDILSLSDSHTPDAASVCRVTQPVQGDQAALTRRDVESELWRTIANTRLAAAAPAERGYFVAYAVGGNVPGLMSAECLSSAPLDGAWAKTLTSLSQQVARLSADPPSEDEVEAAINALRSKIRGAIYGAATRDSSDLAQTTLAALSRDQAEPSPFETMRVFDEAVEGATPASVRAAFLRDWSGAGPLVAVMAHEAPDAAAVRQAWLAAAPAKVSAAAQPPVWRYGDFGRAGKVVKRQVIAASDFVRLTFANGVVLNFKQTDFAKDRVEVRLAFGVGQGGLAPADYYAALLGSELMPLGGLERNSAADIKALFAEYDPKFAISMEPRSFIASETASSGGFSTNLQVLAAFATEPGFRDVGAFLPTFWRVILQKAQTDPSYMARTALYDTIAPGNPIGEQGAEAASKTLTAADVERVLKPAITTSPLEVTVVGDVSEQAASDAVASTFGALKPRLPPAPRADAWFLRYPDHPPQLITATHDGPPEKAVVELVWPLWIGEPARQDEENVIILVSQVLSDALLRQIRGEIGKAYAPSAGIVMHDHGDQGSLVARADVSTADAEAVRDQMATVAAKIARGEFTDQDVENARTPLLAALTKGMATNAFWAVILERSSQDDADARAAPGLIKAFSQITPAEMRQAAAAWLGHPPIAVVVRGRPPVPPAAKERPAP